jgi:hypothetical protein
MPICWNCSIGYAPDEVELEKMLVTNSAKLFGFDSA